MKNFMVGVFEEGGVLKEELDGEVSGVGELFSDGDLVAAGGLEGGLWRKGFIEKEFTGVAMFMERALDGIEKVFLNERFEEGVGAMDEIGEVVAGGHRL